MDPPQRRPPSIQSSLSRSSSTPSSSRAGLGALTAVVERATARWARRRGRSSTSSSSSSRSSITTVARSAKQSRRSRGQSISQSEKNFAAHIALVKARKETQQVSRQFTLYLPPFREKRCSNANQSLTITDSLSLVLDELDLALQKSFRAQRTRENGPHIQTATTGANTATSSVHGEWASQLAPPLSHRRAQKMKGRSISIRRADAVAGLGPKPFYLDVASPSWEDLRALGKLLHLHPLTLEDILQQEPREKVEIFPRLGYYFISFRAVEDKSSRDRTHEQVEKEAIGEANVYLAVFKQGICTFHFTDISAHTTRVLNRMNQLEELFNLSADWIAYETLDSIVDSFFPYLEEIDTEVVAIEKLLFSRGDQQSIPTTEPFMHNGMDKKISEKLDDTYSKERDGDGDTLHKQVKFEANPRACLFYAGLQNSGLQKRLRRLALHLKLMSHDNLMQDSKATLRRIGRMRRLVTSLSRLLATKYDVVAQIRKRLLIDSQLMIASGVSQSSMDVAMYMGDMQDHIDTLQQSLTYYERMLSQLHPTYLSQLRADVELTKDGNGKGLLYLSVITVATLCIQSYIGIFSMNVTLPHNTRDPTGSYHVFGFVMATSVMISVACCSLVWYWWEQAKLRRTNL